MTTTILSFVILGAIFAYIYWRLYVTNMDIPPEAEEKLPSRKALQFAIDNNIPLNVAEREYIRNKYDNR